MPKEKAKGGKKQRKWGHNKRKACHAKYISENRMYHHKVHKISKHILHNPDDHAAETALAFIESKRPRIR